MQQKQQQLEEQQEQHQQQRIQQQQQQQNNVSIIKDCSIQREIKRNKQMCSLGSKRHKMLMAKHLHILWIIIHSSNLFGHWKYNMFGKGHHHLMTSSVLSTFFGKDASLQIHAIPFCKK